MSALTFDDIKICDITSLSTKDKLPLGDLPRSSVARITNSLDITLAVYHGLKATNQTKLNITIFPCLKGSKWGYTELSDFILSVRHSDILSFRHNSVFVQYIENE